MKRDPKTDILAKAAEKIAAEDMASKCVHPNLAFSKSGAKLQCIDCSRRWHTTVRDFDLPDFIYGNPSIPEGETRHSRYEAQRTEPKAPRIK